MCLGWLSPRDLWMWISLGLALTLETVTLVLELVHVCANSHLGIRGYQGWLSLTLGFVDIMADSHPGIRGYQGWLSPWDPWISGLTHLGIRGYQGWLSPWVSWTSSSVALVLELVDIRADSHLGIRGCEGCGFPNQVKRKPLHHLPVLMVHDVHHFSLQSH